MKLIAEICVDPGIKCEKHKIRKTARAILLNSKGQICLTHERAPGFHLLPGGGIDPGESVRDAVVRECLEEAGAKIEILGELGMTIEYRNTEQYIPLKIRANLIIRKFNISSQNQDCNQESTYGILRTNLK